MFDPLLLFTPIYFRGMESFNGSKHGFSCALHPALNCCPPAHTALRLPFYFFPNSSIRPRRQLLKILFGLHAAGLLWPACLLVMVWAHLQAGRLLLPQFSKLKLDFEPLSGFYLRTMSAKLAALPTMPLD